MRRVRKAGLQLKRFVPIVLLLAGAFAAWSGLLWLETFESPAGQDDLLYLPNGKYLRVASLGHASLLADLVYLWSIQYYSDYERADRYRYVEHVYRDVIPELDPHYIDAYALGTLILVVEARDIDAALRVLDRGIEANPDQWILPWLAGWESYRAQRLERAVEYFDLAASIPGAPTQIIRNRAGMVARSGDLRAAYRLWKDLYDDPTSDTATRTIAGSRMADVHVRIDLQVFSDGIREYRERHGRLPRSLSELARAGILEPLPLDPAGSAYLYDSITGEVSSAAGRVLGDR